MHYLVIKKWLEKNNWKKIYKCNAFYIYRKDIFDGVIATYGTQVKLPIDEFVNVRNQCPEIYKEFNSEDCGVDHKVIPSLDINNLSILEDFIRVVDNSNFVYGYKVGFSLGLTYGLPKVVEVIRKISSKPIIYDHQKASTDVPHTGREFADIMKISGIDEVILFPQSGPYTFFAWADALKLAGLKIVVGGLMTHGHYTSSEGGNILDCEYIYENAVNFGITNFVAPIKIADNSYIFESIIKDAYNPVIYSPGFGAQGGDLDDLYNSIFTNVNKHYLIIGRSLLKATDKMKYLEDLENSIKDLRVGVIER